MFQINHLNKSFISKNKQKTTVLNNVSFRLPDKGLIFILGKSGSGKSTLLNLLGGLDFYDTGEILINNHSTKNFKQKDLDNYRNGNVGFIFQEFNLIEEMTVLENIALPLELQGKKPDINLIASYLREIELTGFESRKISELSGGQKQRVAILRAIIKNPNIILADEPTGNLDSETGQQVFEILKKLSKEKLIIVVSHDFESAYRYGDRLIELKNGQLLTDLSKNENFSKQKLELKKGQVLTKKHLEEIQQQSNNNFKKSFVSTKLDNNNISSVQKELLQIKSHLNLKTAFKIGTNFLKVKKISLLFVSLLGAFLLAFSYIDFVYITFYIKFWNLLKKKFLTEFLNEVMLIMLIIFVLSFFVIGGFVKKSIQFKRKDIGTMRSLGARAQDVFKIFFSEGFVISVIINIFYFCIFVLYLKNSIGRIFIKQKIEEIKLLDQLKNAKSTINTNFTDLFTQPWFMMIICFLLSLLIVFSSTYLPISKLARKKPIDVILNK
ncbi:ATP-binding cassette domain-containing protein [Candidatus Phytoplasma melaleucae]|uniref:ATP-binding cassette domain-containing protein n=1 Tax=Candidatus Phytoplasma melaleucae TaxID=2982630 RepID=A0ABT9DD47_9MOLU|nr:ATP-binding cassette domain-containing protein ['Melaleuca sp.' phytoplasma]MDO8168018.1 ATP-binding cassette domain-containing protein ['Melaleuca sp.' phytoplasma]